MSSAAVASFIIPGVLLLLIVAQASWVLISWLVMRRRDRRLRDRLRREYHGSE